MFTRKGEIEKEIKRWNKGNKEKEKKFMREKMQKY